MYPIYSTIVPNTESVQSMLSPSSSTARPVQIMPKLQIQAPVQYPSRVIMGHPQIVLSGSGQPAANFVNVSSKQIINRPLISRNQTVSKTFKQPNQSQVSKVSSPQTSCVTSGSIPSKQVVRYVDFQTRKPTTILRRAATPIQNTHVNTSSVQTIVSKPRISTDSGVNETEDVVITATISKQQLDEILNKTTKLKETETPMASSPTTKIHFKRPKLDSTVSSDVLQNSSKVIANQKPHIIKQNKNSFSDSARSEDKKCVNEDFDITGEISDEELESSKSCSNQETQTEIYSCLYKNNKLYILGRPNSKPNFLPVELTDVIPSTRPTMKSIGTDTVDLRVEAATNEPMTSTKKYEPQSAFEENLYTTLGLYSRPDAQTEDQHSEPNSSSANPDNSELHCTQTANVGSQLVDSESTPAQTGMDNLFDFGDLGDLSPTSNLIETRNLQGGDSNIIIPPQMESFILNLRRQINSCLDKNYLGDRPIHQAVRDQNWMVLKSQCIVLKSIKSHLDHVNYENQTALSLAVREQARISDGVCEGVTVLLAEGASQVIPDAQGCYPLHLAVQLAHVDLVKVLLAADNIVFAINRCNDEGVTPLHLATSMNHAALIQLLVSAGADHSIKDRKSGKTAYFIACEKGHVEAAKMLAALGADTVAPNYGGQPPPLIQHPSSMEQEECVPEKPSPSKNRGRNPTRQKKTDEVIENSKEPSNKRFRYIHDVSSLQESSKGCVVGIPDSSVLTRSNSLNNQPSPDSCVQSDQELPGTSRLTMSTSRKLDSSDQTNKQKPVSSLISLNTSYNSHHLKISNPNLNENKVMRLKPTATSDENLSKDDSPTKDEVNLKRKRMIYIGSRNQSDESSLNSIQPAKTIKVYSKSSRRRGK